MLSKRSVEVGCSDIDRKLYETLVKEHGTPLLVYDASVVQHQYAQLTAAIPGVKLYYAVKAHPHDYIIRTIDKLGGGFDVASAGETDLLLQLKVFGRRTIHTHPIKKHDEIRTALRFGVTTFVVDNLYELEKLVPYRQRVGILLRLSFRSATATVDLSKKFGCDIQEAAALIQQARDLGLHVKGLSFHVGSQCVDGLKHVESIEKCYELMVAMNQFGGSPLNVLDIGGGFPADYDRTGVDIQGFCEPIRNALDQLPENMDVGLYNSLPNLVFL